MSSTLSDPNCRRLRMLVAIASYGKKNDSFLKRIIQKYQGMAMDVDFVVLSEAAKELGPEIKVIVGLPSENPWSLPFAHKEVFVQNVDRYDLFAYSEDDMDVTEKNIQAFLQVTPVLLADEIAGFLRYEVDETGNLHVPEAHGSAHWKPETVKQRGNYIVAEFSNEHAGFYLLTQSQLKQVIASGNFMRSPYEGKYGLPETAATDPYTCCGFRKVICVSALEDFLIHHLPNRYIGKLGNALSTINQQVQTIVDISKRAHPASTLCVVESKMMHRLWSKCFDETYYDEVLEMVPQDSKSLLSVGCGSGAFETQLIQQQKTVTALPLNSVSGSVVERLGVEMIYGNLEEGMAKLAGRKFDCIVVTNLLHLQPNPEKFLTECARSVDKGGTLMVSVPNFNRIPTALKRHLRIGEFKKLQDFTAGGVNPLSVNFIKQRLKKLGFRNFIVHWFDRPPQKKHRLIRRVLGRFAAKEWVLLANR